MPDMLTNQEIINLKQRYELILQSIGEGVYGLDSDGNTTFVNPAAETMTGWLSDDLIGQVVHDFHHHTKSDGSHYPSCDCPVYKTIQDGIGRHVDDEIFWRKDGSSFPVEYVTTAIVRDERIIGAVVVFKDISERKQADEQLKAALIQVEKLRERLQAENRYLREEIKEGHNFSKIIGNSPALHQILTQIEHVAPTNASVLIQGDSGTGKELIARAIHSASNRKDRPLVKINCGAITQSLVESELFGHEKGAFTGALQQRIGRFELANGGTLFLDEIGELPLDVQVKLLRVLQEGEFERVGSSVTQKIDVRVIAATNRNILEMVNSATFRGDLYYRLSVFPIQVPSLQQRIEDLPMLANHILTRLNQALGKKYEAISAKSLDQLRHYHWPGNIRELQNTLEHAAIVGHPPFLEVNNLPNQVKKTSLPTTLSTTLAEAERQHIINTLNSVNWTIAGKQGAAAILDLPPSTLRSKMKKLSITRLT